MTNEEIDSQRLIVW